MTIRTALWSVGAKPTLLESAKLANERLLEDMIVSAPSLLSDEWMLIGRQESTGYGGQIDLLAIAPDGQLILIENKRDRTPREVVAQALDYAGWVQTLQADDIASIYGRFAPGKNLANDFKLRFGQDLDEETLNESHQIVIVAGSLDDRTERIIAYLRDRDIAINVLCFQVFAIGTEQIISRTWLNDPFVAEVSAATAPDGPTEPWNGEFYHSYGDDESRSWADAVQYGFICGGGAAWYSRTLRQLKQGDRVWVNIPGSGYVGVGRVTGPMQPASEFMVSTPDGEKPVLEVAKGAKYHAEFIDDPDHCEYFVPVHWLQTVPQEQAIREIGLFGNQNTVCKPTKPKWRSTVERLKTQFPNFDK